MGKKIKFKEARRRASESDLTALLRARPRDERAAVDCFGDFEAARRGEIETYRDHALRAPELWRSRVKSRSPDKRFRDLVRFVFARYRVAPHLENAWLGEAAMERGLDFRRWYILVGQGGSLYRQVTHAFLSKLETHHLLDPPAAVVSTSQAFWYAYARAQTDDAMLALNVSCTKLLRFSPLWAFWREAARYFAHNPLPIAEMNDFIDYFEAMLAEDGGFSLKGRSLTALHRRVEDWHRMLQRRQSLGGGNWPGLAFNDIAYEAGDEGKQAIWSFSQIKTGNDLFKEGERMRHCVASYKDACMEGRISIWSLRCEYPLGKVNRSVTMEVRDGEIVQCRGFANRQPYANELMIVKQWAGEHGLAWRAVA